jgi:transposase
MMELARYVVEAVVREGRSYREVARAHGVSKSWVGKVGPWHPRPRRLRILRDHRVRKVHRGGGGES